MLDTVNPLFTFLFREFAGFLSCSIVAWMLRALLGGKMLVPSFVIRGVTLLVAAVFGIVIPQFSVLAYLPGSVQKGECQPVLGFSKIFSYSDFLLKKI